MKTKISKYIIVICIPMASLSCCTTVNQNEIHDKMIWENTDIIKFSIALKQILNKKGYCIINSVSSYGNGRRSCIIIADCQNIKEKYRIRMLICIHTFRTLEDYIFVDISGKYEYKSKYKGTFMEIESDSSIYNDYVKRVTFLFIEIEKKIGKAKYKVLKNV